MFSFDTEDEGLSQAVDARAKRGMYIWDGVSTVLAACITAVCMHEKKSHLQGREEPKRSARKL